MTANVIQHQGPRRKRAGAWSWTTRHFGLLAVAVIAVFAASWLAPEMAQAPAPATTLRAPDQAALSPTPETITVDIAADLVRPSRVQPRAVARNPGVPLNATATFRADEYEILSAAELDSISQARN